MTNGGGGQTADVGADFPEPISVEITDLFGAPTPGWPVTFTINSGPGGGAAFPDNSQTAAATTDASGRATSPLITATTAGMVKLSVTTGITGVSTAVPLDINPSPPTSMSIVGGNNQSAVAGSAFPNQLAVKVLDGNGQQPERPVTVTFSVTGGDATFAGDKSRVQVPAVGGGIATAPPLTAAPSASGPMTVRAEVEDSRVPAVTFDLSVTALAPSQLNAASGGGQSAYTGDNFADPLVGEVLDPKGDPLPGTYVTFTVTGPASFAGLLSLTVATDQTGKAIITQLVADSTGGPVQVTASIAGTPLHIVFDETTVARAATSVQPRSGNQQSAAPDQPFADPLVALVLDQTNTIYPGAPVTFTITGPASFAGKSSIVVDTDATGEAHAIVTAGSTTGTVTVSVSVPGATNLGGNFTLVVAYPANFRSPDGRWGDSALAPANRPTPRQTSEATPRTDQTRKLCPTAAGIAPATSKSRSAAPAPAVTRSAASVSMPPPPRPHRR